MKRAFDGNFAQLVREMDAAARVIDEFPDDQRWTQDELAYMDDVRHSALRLADRRRAALLKDIASGMKKSEAARKYDISATHVGRIVSGKSRRTNA